MLTSVLIIEDAPCPLGALAQELPADAYAIYQARSLEEVLHVLETYTVNVLIVSVRDMEYLGLLQREMEKLPRTPCVIVTCTPEERAYVSAATGHYGWICVTKPANLDALRDSMNWGMETARIKMIEMAKRGSAGYIDEKAHFSRIAISALLETALEPLSLDKQLDVALEIILTLPWLSIQKKAAVFLTDGITGELHLTAQKNMSAPLLVACARVPLGHCLCGKAAQKREVIFTNQVNEDHDIRFSGMVDHGHYCAPILSHGSLLGVLNLYVPALSQFGAEEDAFIATATNTLAVIIEHRKMQSNMAKLEAQLRQMAYHDPLTGLLNRQSFDDVFGKIFTSMMKRNRQTDHAPSQGMFLAVLDIDHFKKVNDTYGHLMGDEVLVLFARHMGQCFRSEDATFRFGGEEFVVLLANLSLEAARNALNRFRQTIAAFDFPQVGCVTVSIGAVEIEANEMAGIFIEKADKALYYSKSNGRNQVNFYQDLVDTNQVENVEHSSNEVDLW